MRVTAASLNAQVEEFCRKLFDRTDPKGYDVFLASHGETIWQVNIENLHDKDTYVVEYHPKTQEWSWIRVIAA